ncbi:hypothetical protein OPQ81_000353 [Rhizoctonia solani]|nr:hypothetical protein OPQ81_000353 [Rhizoctonia solani]
MIPRSLPGPVGTSCLTCKKRHKKCDQRRPACARRRGEPSQYIICRPIAINNQVHSGKEKDEIEKISSTGNKVEATNLSTYSPQPSASSRVHLKRRISSKSVGKLSTPALSLHQLFARFPQLPLSPSNPTLAFLSCPQFEDYILAQLDRLMNYAYFKPIQDQKAWFFGIIASRLQRSWTTRWVALLDARICEGLIQDTFQPQLYTHWIKDLEVAVRTMLARDPRSPDVHSIQGDWLGLLVMKTALGPSSNAIQVLRSAAPTFLQIAYSCPELWPDNSDLTSIPLMNVATSSRHELAVFALIDCTCALVFGIPQLVEYDTNAGSLPDGPLPYEWAHCSPVEFLIILAEINACRDKRPGARDWRDIEHQLITWLARPTQHNESWESWMVVAWLAVQESWRLTLLAYLYLAVCGASSDEPRVQWCVSQILQVVGTVRKHDLPDVSIPFFTQYLMAGICAIHEKHRRTVRNKLSNNSETKFWRMRGTDFVPVLDHLWHGAGSGGRPIKWSDYIRSREALIPLVT